MLNHWFEDLEDEWKYGYGYGSEYELWVDDKGEEDYEEEQGFEVQKIFDEYYSF